MEALLLIQCVWYSCWKRPHLKLASWKHTLTFTWKFWCWKKNYSSSKCLFLDYLERKDRKITQQWECWLQGACSLFHQPMSCPCRLRSVTPVLLSAIKEQTLPQVASSLKANCCTYNSHSQAPGSLEEIMPTLRATAVLGTFPCGVDASSSERSAAILAWKDANKRLHVPSATCFSGTSVRWGMGATFTQMRFATLGGVMLVFQKFKIQWDQQVLCPIPTCRQVGLQSLSALIRGIAISSWVS